jgi:hypothetical protein
MKDKDAVDLVIVMGSSLKVHPVASILDLIPAYIPQVYINKESCRHHNFDMELLGTCDEIIEFIQTSLGWKDEESKASKEVTSDEVPFEFIPSCHYLFKNHDVPEALKEQWQKENEHDGCCNHDHEHYEYSSDEYESDAPPEESEFQGDLDEIQKVEVENVDLNDSNDVIVNETNVNDDDQGENIVEISSKVEFIDSKWHPNEPPLSALTEEDLDSLERELDRLQQ